MPVESNLRPRAVAVIPARGGSKRVPRKNIRPFHGKPILAWSIAAARESGCFDEVIVTTDDEEIAAVAREHGARVPFLRAENLSDDKTALAPVVADALDRLGAPCELACCILPTAAFTTAGLISRARSLLLATPECPMVFGAVRYGHPVQRGFRVVDGLAEMMFPEHQLTRSQDLPPVFHDAGQFYFFRVEAFRARGGFFFDGAACIELPEVEVHDIDSEADWVLAEIKWDLLQRK